MPGRNWRRGRGGRGSRGRGGGSRRFVRGGDQGPSTDDKKTELAQSTSANFREDTSGFFTKNISFDSHVKAQTDDRLCYCATIRALEEWQVDIPQHTKVKTLAAAWARGDHELADLLLQRKKMFGVVEVYKAVTLLDSGRTARAFEKKLKRLQIQKNKVKADTMGKLKSNIDNLMTIKPTIGSSSGAVCKHVKRWTRTLTKQELEFFALFFPVDLWKKLADVCHFHPVKDFSVPWFLPFCFGESPPEDSLVHKFRSITESNVNELLRDHDVPYTKVKPLIGHITDEIKGKIAQREEKLDTILWYYEDLKCPEVDREIETRLERGDPVTLAIGKLLDRVLLFHLLQAGHSTNIADREKEICEVYNTWDWDTKPEGPGEWECVPDPDVALFSARLENIAQKQIEKIRFSVESPVVILGDKSGSMDIAIRTSSIIAGILAVVTSAKLIFFDDKCMDAPYVPISVQEVINLALEVKAGGGTCPAAALLPFYDRKEVVKTFVIVTDEEEAESESSTNLKFAELYKQYHDEVYPAKLIFVSFLPQNKQGEMVETMRSLGFRPLQFKFDGTRPDLSKLDNLFALQSTETSIFQDDVEKLEKRMTVEGIAAVYQDIE
uniref:TROVE domain-containing protein n=1 Tax=Magallana gigas TaxID=29159 RepID=A0A8W8LPY3_MAGGI|nr:uncharacterized protein LOC105347606 [Crassostrea gigas]